MLLIFVDCIIQLLHENKYHINIFFIKYRNFFLIGHILARQGFCIVVFVDIQYFKITKNRYESRKNG